MFLVVLVGSLVAACYASYSVAQRFEQNRGHGPESRWAGVASIGVFFAVLALGALIAAAVA